MPRSDCRQRAPSHPINRVAAFVRIGWPLSIGIGGRLPSESVAALPRIPHERAAKEKRKARWTEREREIEEPANDRPSIFKRGIEMTVLIYVNTSKQVGDPEHIKVFATTDAAETWFEENDPEGVAFEYEVLVRQARRFRSKGAVWLSPSVGHEPDRQEAASEEK